MASSGGWGNRIRAGSRPAEVDFAAMRSTYTSVLLGLALAVIGCGPKAVKGTASFVLGPTAGSGVVARSGPGSYSRSRSKGLTAGAEYIVSPLKGQVTFTEIGFLDKSGSSIGGHASLTNCT